MIKVRTQSALDAAIAADPGELIVCVGNGPFYASGSATVQAYDSATVQAYDSATVQAYDSATVQAYDSATVRAYSSATVQAYDSATVQASGSATVQAYDSATVQAYGSATVRAYDSATVRAYSSATVQAYDSATVQAYGSATVRASGSATVRASDSATVRASDSATVRASEYVAVTRHGTRAKVTGGVLVQVPRLTTPAEWCEFHGVAVKRGIVTLYKAVNDDYESAHGTSYAPGTKPEAPDWDPVPECGGGLHFSPRPSAALAFAADAARFVACPVRLDEIVVHPDGLYPEKVKAPRVVGKGCYEVNIDGEPI